MSEGVHNGLDHAAMSGGNVTSFAEEQTTGGAPNGKKLFKKLVLAVTGSVGAAVEIPRFSFLLRRMFVEELVIVLSTSAQRFVSPYVAAICAGRPAVTDGETTDPYLVPHVQVTKGADLLLVMPATANILAKAANGIADEIVSATVLAALCPVAFVPNMNGAMWANAATRANISRLKEFGHHIVEPTWGTEVATLERTFGAMPAFSQILRSVASAVKARGLQEAQL
jgi:phosphopantothenoylcysteine decarboxylase/phosphopantothenate--cysteine ligase